MKLQYLAALVETDISTKNGDMKIECILSRISQFPVLNQQKVIFWAMQHQVKTQNLFCIILWHSDESFSNRSDP